MTAARRPSTGTVFSAGVDLKRVTAEREGYVAAFLPELRRAFTRLAVFELPVVAAVNGHAIAGGELARLPQPAPRRARQGCGIPGRGPDRRAPVGGGAECPGRAA
jgi:hypothetical protein